MVKNQENPAFKKGYEVIFEPHVSKHNEILIPFPPGSKFPAGYNTFLPTDEQLIVDYLKRKVYSERLPANSMRNLNFYLFDPQQLSVLTNMYKMEGDKAWFFFVPRDQKYLKWTQLKRAAGDGYWSDTHAEKIVYSGNHPVGLRKTLVFFKGKPRRGVETDLIMHEYRLVGNSSPRTCRAPNDIEFDDWVLCKVYKKIENGKKKRIEGNEGMDMPDLKDQV